MWQNDMEYMILSSDYEELLYMCDDKKKKEIWIKTFEPHGYITIDEAKDLIKALETMIDRIEK
jgi:hypothetical protein